MASDDTIDSVGRGNGALDGTRPLALKRKRSPYSFARRSTPPAESNTLQVEELGDIRTEDNYTILDENQ